MTIHNIHEFNQLDVGSSNRAVLNLVKYIEDTLPELPNSPEFVNVLEKKRNENQYSSAFCLYMTNQCKSTYNFQSQKSQIGSYTVDIGVYQGAILIFTIEAKVLPTPKGSKNNPRTEHEYVYGQGAGIQRFRDGFHGVDDQNNPLPENGMIAYIKEQDFKYWLAKVNQWVLDAQWDKSEQFEENYFKQIAKLISKHPRQNSSEVVLHHFWIYVS